MHKTKKHDGDFPATIHEHRADLANDLGMGNFFTKKRRACPIPTPMSYLELYNKQCDLMSYYQIIDCRERSRFQQSHVDMAVHFEDALETSMFWEIIFYGDHEDAVERAVKSGYR